MTLKMTSVHLSKTERVLSFQNTWEYSLVYCFVYPVRHDSECFFEKQRLRFMHFNSV